MPLATVVVDAKTSDSKMLIPCLEQLNKLEVPLPNMIADMGYIDGDDRGRVTCPEGYLAIYEEFNKESLTVTYCGDSSYCSNCLRYGTCYKEFTHPLRKIPNFLVQ